MDTNIPMDIQTRMFTDTSMDRHKTRDTTTDTDTGTDINIDRDMDASIVMIHMHTHMHKEKILCTHFFRFIWGGM